MPPLNFIFGLGIFLFGMSQLEKGIHRLSDARLKGLLRSSTNTTFGSISMGVISTAVLQSSSMVSLLVLAFASAGLLPLVNAIGIILGANLGTTITGWIVATIGFKMDLEAMAIPLMGISSLLLVLMKNRSRANSIALAFLGIALLLFGLGIMKTSMETIPQQWDVSVLRGHHPVVYLLFGIALSSLIQSSSAVMMMALAALNADFITLQEAASLVIGADLGTTSTTILGSIYGSVVKRKLAFAHCSFNFIVDISAFLLLLPLLPQLLSLLQITDPLYGLVAFHSIMNLLGVIVFAPFLRPFANWIEKIFSSGKPQSQSLLEQVPANVTDAALVAVKDTVVSIAIQAACNAMKIFSLQPEKMKLIIAAREKLDGIVTSEKFERAYENLKQNEGALLQYSAKIQSQPLDETQARALESYCATTRSIIYSNKTLKDISRDLEDLKHSNLESSKSLLDKHKQFHKETYHKLLELILKIHPNDYISEELEGLNNLNEKHYEEMNSLVYSQASLAKNENISMQLNVNHEVHHATKNMLLSITNLIATQNSVLG
ncbi:MAG: hypothetical protein COA96_10020 [SAR86 cluster bacterium]|uniref:Na/Pi cotransporter family protein n=1 Tax=SAR86 cluster bacterium TaxID=2030880 RepID=A0A2A5AY51_9GAMM|nr:MAG: hypothetical protein COA96_10020 [SAR86 cluster bacterium]